jgi:antitoxin (DNA-binding transcriptional repressor) of toxin-antitoxin stability system
MDQVPISKFKATCLAILERVRRSRRPVLVTRFGKPVAEINPPSPRSRPEEWLGCMRGEGKIVGDVVSPAFDEADWEVLRK